MDLIVTPIEREILLKVFEGDYSGFEILRRQIDKLFVRDRRRRYHTYDVLFGIRDAGEKIDSGTKRNMKVEDAVLFINESGSAFHVQAQVVDGSIEGLLIGGDFDFERDFSVKNVSWEVRNDDPGKEPKLIYKASERDFLKAISYIPMYK